MTTLAELYLDERDGSSFEYRQNFENGQRVGQAFFNALSRIDQERLQWNVHNPFYHTVNVSYHIERAIEWLLDTE